MPVGTLDITLLPRRPAPPPDPRPRPHPDAAAAASTARSSCSSTTCSTPAAPSARRSTRSPTSAARASSGSPSSSTAATASCPIRADHVGKNLPTARNERVQVRLDRVRRRRGRCGSRRQATVPTSDAGGRMNKHLLSVDDLDREPTSRRVLDDRGRDARRAAPRGQEAARPARAHGRQPLLRGLHPHPLLVRDRGQVALGRRRSTSPAKGSSTSARASRLRDTVQTVDAMGVDGLVIRACRQRRRATRSPSGPTPR